MESGAASGAQGGMVLRAGAGARAGAAVTLCADAGVSAGAVRSGVSGSECAGTFVTRLGRLRVGRGRGDTADFGESISLLIRPE